MKLLGLFGMIFLMWVMINTVSLFLIVVVAPLHISIFHNFTDRFITSAVQAVLAIGIVIILIIVLSKMKSLYLKRTINIT
jgi:hypothetical protein